MCIGHWKRASFCSDCLSLTLKSASKPRLSVCVKTFLLMISAPSRPLSSSLHLIISPNIITYSEALKRQTIPWHSNIHQESAASLKILIKHAQHKHTETHTEIHTAANSAFWEALPRGANKFLFGSLIFGLIRLQDVDAVPAEKKPLCERLYWTFGWECAAGTLRATMCSFGRAADMKTFKIMSSVVTYFDNFLLWHPASKLPAPGCHVGCMFLMKITCQEGMPFNGLSVE